MDETGVPGSQGQNLGVPPSPPTSAKRRAGAEAGGAPEGPASPQKGGGGVGGGRIWPLLSSERGEGGGGGSLCARSLRHLCRRRSPISPGFARQVGETLAPFCSAGQGRREGGAGKSRGGSRPWWAPPSPGPLGPLNSFCPGSPPSPDTPEPRVNRQGVLPRRKPGTLSPPPPVLPEVKGCAVATPPPPDRLSVFPLQPQTRRLGKPSRGGAAAGGFVLPPRGLGVGAGEPFVGPFERTGGGV